MYNDLIAEKRANFLHGHALGLHDEEPCDYCRDDGEAEVDEKHVPTTATTLSENVAGEEDSMFINSHGLECQR